MSLPTFGNSRGCRVLSTTMRWPCRIIVLESVVSERASMNHPLNVNRPTVAKCARTRRPPLPRLPFLLSRASHISHQHTAHTHPFRKTHPTPTSTTSIRRSSTLRPSLLGSPICMCIAVSLGRKEERKTQLTVNHHRPATAPTPTTTNPSHHAHWSSSSFPSLVPREISRPLFLSLSLCFPPFLGVQFSS